jgi:chromosome segregation ATPase
MEFFIIIFYDAYLLSLSAQTKVEQQRLTLLNLEEKSKNLDQQVCNEIVKIKAKFQEKLSELCHYPQKYEESKCELNESKKKIKILENDLKTSLNALTHAKEELKRLEEKCDENLEMKYKQLECENEMMRKRFCSIKETKKCLEDKLCEMKKEHELTRQESTKIIEITKKCADQNRMTMNQHISGLEIELAQCRASTSIQLSEKEESIKKLRKELSELCEHFNFCQNQIKCMKSQVSHLSSQCSTGDN